ncbi:hypothetical protein PCL_01440 [Purpureocillium lilacinum]|uniref:Uncharacterized protein n=1 Tax=Purpureocillium lilacinum TaxID=33203 RepID=A0A2U3E3G3_PURLI|nr:hypothetical protein PCL_01440 [Purpureocillium lilacinum]
MEEVFDTCHWVLSHVLQAIALGLNLPAQQFLPLHDARHHEMRLLHYPATVRSQAEQWYFSYRGPHRLRLRHVPTNFRITLAARLQARRPEGNEYFDLNSSSEDMLVILGYCFQRWTGDLLRAAPRRVTIPSGRYGTNHEGDLPERFPIAFFGKPDGNVRVGNMDEARYSQNPLNGVGLPSHNVLDGAMMQRP